MGKLVSFGRTNRPDRPQNVAMRDPRSRKVPLSHEARLRLQKIVEGIGIIQTILADKGFIRLARERGVTDAPLLLTPKKGTLVDRSGWSEDIENCIGRHVLDFTAAWRFLFPLLSDDEIARYVEKKWPKAIGRLKDTFIELVMYGPFPSRRQNTSGERP